MRKSRLDQDPLNRMKNPHCQGGIKGSVNLLVMLPIITVLAILITTGCDESLDSLQENDRYFYSVNGYLDATADTQWVRVMPVRESITPAAEIEVPTVTLEHAGSGETVLMKDTLIHFEDERKILNFWTTMEILPEETYHLTVEGHDGRISSAQTTLPGDYPTPFFSQPEFGEDILIINSVEQLADLQVIYRIEFYHTEVVFNVRYPQLQNGFKVEQSRYRAPIDPDLLRLQLMEAYCNFTVLERNVFVASGGPGWPDFVSLDRHTIALPDYLSNIENGVGFFGGIISKTFPYIDIEGDDGLFEYDCP